LIFGGDWALNNRHLFEGNMANKRRARRRGPKPNPLVRGVQLDPDQILEWRLDQGLSQVAAAKEIGIATMTYRKCEADNAVVSLLNATKIARRLQIPLDKLRAARFRTIW
jgi:DNA-binding XRE family transcriptional regulator